MTEPVPRITLRRPDDWHVHLRDGAVLAAVAPYTAARFGRAIVMPNLVPPVTTRAQANAYKARIMQALPADTHFTPLMTCYLTDEADADEIAGGYAAGDFAAVKLYPAGATTNSTDGVTDLNACARVFEAMQDCAMPLLVHGEVVDPDVDVFDRERVFIERVLAPLLADFPGLRVVLEHITSEEAVDFVRAQRGQVGATITAHHLMINRNAMFEGGMRPHMYCLPVAKRERHRQALRGAATSGPGPFFLGTDSAPHPRRAKETACGCAGIFSAPAALEMYAQVFAEEGALEALEAFASLNGPAFYGLPANQELITMIAEDWRLPEAVDGGDGETVLPFAAGAAVAWRLAAD